MPASVQPPGDRECRSGSRIPPRGGDGSAAHRGAEVLDEGRQGPLHEPPSRDAGANRRARAVTGGRLQPPSAGGRRKEQGPRGRTLEGGTGKATVRGRAAAASPDAGAATGGRVRRYQNLGGRRTAREDWPRYALWDVQQRIAEVGQHLALAQQRQARSACSSSRNSPGARTISSRESPAGGGRQEAAGLQTAALACSRNWASRKQNWRNRGTTRGLVPA